MSPRHRPRCRVRSTPLGTHRAPRRGFSLIEVLVAMVLLIIAAVSVSSYTLNTSSSRLMARQKSLALVAIQETIDSVRTLGFDGATVGTFNRSRTVGELPLTVQVTVATSQATSKVIDVAVTNADGTLLQRFITSLYDENR